ncbi:MAG: 16S rRNA (guanine(966)-N(2))-methyltransferase RsmD [Myxococcales bacterium]|nr:16S rRNA (guanine(966)-N(2))-methyltransferase RsmD [Myxococcales bacterium]
MRIISGFAGGRRLRAPSGNKTRPTSDRVREALFSILGLPPEGCHVLDLFAGSGGLGLEALSRGAVRAVFVDRDKDAQHALRHNIGQVGVAPATDVHQGDALRVLAKLGRTGAAFHWIFIDPPYATDFAAQALESIGGGNLLRPTSEDGRLIVEHDKRGAPGDAYGCLIKVQTRRYGDTCVSFYERKSA